MRTRCLSVTALGSAAWVLGVGGCASLLGIDDVTYAAGDGGDSDVITTGDDASVPTDAPAEGSEPTADVSARDAARPPVPRFVVFVTSMPFTGQEVGGAQSADSRCSLLAEQHGLGNNFVAWISSSRSDAIDRIPGDAGPWFLNDPSRDAMAFGSRLEIITKGPSEPIAYREDGRPTQDVVVWTGTTSSGRVGPTCNDWTSSSSIDQGMFGRAVDGGFWTESSTDGCSNSHPIYCFQN